MRPPPGVGRLILLLSDLGYVLHPVGAFEEAGAFCLSFGSPFHLELRSPLSRREADRRAGEIVMRAIALQLPPRLQGEFRLRQDGEALST